MFYCRRGRASPEDIRNELRHNDIDPDNLGEALHNKLDGLKKTYHRLFRGSRGQNVTSLMCCHGPAASIHLNYAWVTPSAIAARLLGLPFLCAIADIPNPDVLIFNQMLTGDTNVDINEYQMHFGQELKRVGLFCLPHHGSKHNWHDYFLEIHGNCPLWVCSAGLGNRNRHPHKKVVDTLRMAGKCAWLCHEFQGLTIEASGVARPR